jgi:hypothetical protein
MAVKYVRLKAYNPRGGYKVKRIDWRDSVTGQWFTFAKAGVWHKVDAAIADRMALVHQDQYDERTPLVFDVETETGARQLDAAARAAREAAQAEREPTVDTAVDMTGGSEAEARAAALDAVDDDAEEPEPEEPDDDAADDEPEPEPEPEPERPKRTVKPKAKTTAAKPRTRKPKRSKKK